MRLQIKTGFRRVWRSAESLQIGLSQRRGVVLDGLTTDDIPLLDELRDGVDAARFEPLEAPFEGSRDRELVALLAEAAVLTRVDAPVGPGGGAGDPARRRLGPSAARLAPDAAIWSLVHPRAGDGWDLLAARAQRRVMLVGAGRLGSILSATLSAAGVGLVAVSDRRRVTPADLVPGGASGTDLGRAREEAALDAVRRHGGRADRAELVPGHWGEGPPDLVVLIEHGAADAAMAGRLVSADVAHLSVVIREDDVMVGPLVRPGNGPCLRCLDLHRSDRDPAWPAILTQLLGPSDPSPEETALSGLAAGLAALQVLGHLDGVIEPATVGATLEVELPDGLVARRNWPAHPRCGCHWPLAALPALPEPGGRAEPSATVSPAGKRGAGRTETIGL